MRENSVGEAAVKISVLFSVAACAVRERLNVRVTSGLVISSSKEKADARGEEITDDDKEEEEEDDDDDVVVVSDENSEELFCAVPVMEL